MSRLQGLILSACIHALIFLIPVSMMATLQKQDIELFMTIEDAYLRQEPINKPEKKVVKREKEPQKIIYPSEVASPRESREEAPEPVKEIVEGPSEPQKQPIFVESAAPVAASAAPIDTEFGAAIAPSFLYREMPVYPAFARKLGKEGRVLLRLTIDERGDLIEIEVLEKAGFGFVEAAVDAIKKSTFLPAKKNGKPVASRALLPVRFLLRRDS